MSFLGQEGALPEEAEHRVQSQRPRALVPVGGSGERLGAPLPQVHAAGLEAKLPEKELPFSAVVFGTGPAEDPGLRGFLSYRDGYKYRVGRVNAPGSRACARNAVIL
jgi:hypothetical protein